MVLHALGRNLGPTGICIAVAIPLLVGAPAIFYHLLRQRQLNLDNQRLQVLASTDWLTACLNRGAFTSMVNEQLDLATEGAFLVVDADGIAGYTAGSDLVFLMQGTAASLANLGVEDFI